MHGGKMGGGSNRGSSSPLFRQLPLYWRLTLPVGVLLQSAFWHAPHVAGGPNTSLEPSPNSGPVSLFSGGCVVFMVFLALLCPVQLKR
jgi:hypothetical protein